jgi:hypothetical protein
MAGSQPHENGLKVFGDNWRVCWVIFCLFVTKGALGQQSGSKLPVEVSICELVKHSSSYAGELVRVRASFVSDGMDRSVLVNSDCKRGIEPRISPGVENHPDIRAFNAALDRGEKGTLDKQVTATFFGVFRCKSSCKAREARILEITEISDLKVEFIKRTDH